MIGFNLSDGGAILANIEDIDDKSISKALMAHLHPQSASSTAATEALMAADKKDTETLKAAFSRLDLLNLRWI